jgi:hypothetical protein
MQRMKRHPNQRKLVPARLQAALLLLERLRDHPILVLDEHFSKPGSSGLTSHERYGNQAHQRFGLVPINKNHGRRSSSLRDWGQELLDSLRAAGFEDEGQRTQLIDTAQQFFAAPLRAIINEEPLEARLKNRTAEAIIADLLKQAEEKGKTGDVAQYLVGAKLRLRFNRPFPAVRANLGNRRSRTDPHARLGDFSLEDGVIEVAVGLPDDAHLDQVTDILEESDNEVWLLTRAERVDVWKSELAKLEPKESRRIVVTSVEAFVGQNITELGSFAAKQKAQKLRELFDIYNSEWITALNEPGGIKIQYR